MAEKTPEEVSKIVKELSKKLTDQGLLIEAGWAAMRIIAIPEDAPPEQLDAMRKCFFAGAQHLWASILSVMDPDKEPTDADLKRMDLINEELDQFIKEMKEKEGF